MTCSLNTHRPLFLGWKVDDSEKCNRKLEKRVLRKLECWVKEVGHDLEMTEVSEKNEETKAAFFKVQKNGEAIKAWNKGRDMQNEKQELSGFGDYGTLIRESYSSSIHSTVD